MQGKARQVRAHFRYSGAPFLYFSLSCPVLSCTLLFRACSSFTIYPVKPSATRHFCFFFFFCCCFTAAVVVSLLLG